MDNVISKDGFTWSEVRDKDTVPCDFSVKTTLPTDAESRKTIPIASGVLNYFPKALAEIAKVSYAGNLQHNGPDAPLHWDRSKSQDEADALIRHFLERGKLDSDGRRHSGKMAWRALALLEKELEAAQEKP